MSKQTIEELIENAQSELEEASACGDSRVVHDCEAYLDDLYQELSCAV